jgi:hypothetical protein
MLGQMLYGFTPDMVYLSPAPLYHAAPLRWSMAVQQPGRPAGAGGVAAGFLRCCARDDAARPELARPGAVQSVEWLGEDFDPRIFEGLDQSCR